MKHVLPDTNAKSINEKPKISSGQADDSFGGRHGGREDIQSVAAEQNLNQPSLNRGEDNAKRNERKQS